MFLPLFHATYVRGFMVLVCFYGILCCIFLIPRFGLNNNTCLRFCVLTASPCRPSSLMRFPPDGRRQPVANHMGATTTTTTNAKVTPAPNHRPKSGDSNSKFSVFRVFVHCAFADRVRRVYTFTFDFALVIKTPPQPRYGPLCCERKADLRDWR